MKRLKTLLWTVVASTVVLPMAMAQGLVVFKKDGGRVVYPYEEVDSIVTYNYNETPPGGGSVGDGEKKVITVNGVSFTMIPVEGGSFSMGATPEQSNGYTPDSDESPVHRVTVSSFYMGETEVTQELWYAVMGYQPTSGGSQWTSTYGLGSNYPAYYISHNDCLEFINKLNQLTGMNFRMPTEAEWEYAARGGAKSKGYIFSGSNNIDDVAWYTGNSASSTHPVKTKSPNELGLYDMSGNVYEWCSDWYNSSNYSNSGGSTDPTGPATGSNRVVRGGSWYSLATGCRVAFRGNSTPSSRYDRLGLRLASN